MPILDYWFLGGREGGILVEREKFPQGTGERRFSAAVFTVQQ
jgi:hypothetical protein